MPLFPSGSVRAMVRAIPSGALCVVVEPGSPVALFSPTRAQPGPGRVSTAEAVACVFDEWRAAEAAAAAGGTPRGGGSCSSLSATLEPRWLPPADAPPAPHPSSVAASPAASSGASPGAAAALVASSASDPAAPVARAEADIAAAADPPAPPALPDSFICPPSPLFLRPLAQHLRLRCAPAAAAAAAPAAAALDAPHGDRIMYCDPAGVRVRCLVMTLVDAMTWQRGGLTGPLPPSRGPGYGTWTLGVAPQRRRLARRAWAAQAVAQAAAEAEGGGGCAGAAPPTAPSGATPEEGAHDSSGGIGPFSRIPAFLVRHVVSFVGPPLPEGYFHRPAEGSVLWRGFHSWGGGVSGVTAEQVEAAAAAAAATAAAAAAASKGSAGGAPSAPAAAPASAAAAAAAASLSSASAAGVGCPEYLPAAELPAAEQPSTELPATTQREGASDAAWARWGVYRWGEAPLPHLPRGAASALAATCTDMCACTGTGRTGAYQVPIISPPPSSYCHRVPRLWPPEPCEPLRALVTPSRRRRPSSLVVFCPSRPCKQVCRGEGQRTVRVYLRGRESCA